MYPDEPTARAGACGGASRPPRTGHSADPLLEGHLRLDGAGFKSGGELRLITEHSVRPVRLGTYYRTPRGERAWIRAASQPADGLGIDAGCIVAVEVEGTWDETQSDPDQKRSERHEDRP